MIRALVLKLKFSNEISSVVRIMFGELLGTRKFRKIRKVGASSTQRCENPNQKEIEVQAQEDSDSMKIALDIS